MQQPPPNGFSNWGPPGAQGQPPPPAGFGAPSPYGQPSGYGQGYGPPAGYQQQYQAPPYQAPTKSAQYSNKTVAIAVGLVGLATIGFVGLIAIAPTPATSTRPAVAYPEAVNVTAADLFTAYDRNEVAADDKYKDKRVRVTGTVVSIEKDFGDQIIVRLASSDPLLPVALYGVKKGTAIGLSKGQSFTATCRGDGKLLGVPQLQDCNEK